MSMYRPKIKDWPAGYIRLMQFAAVVAVLTVFVLWFGAYPRWRRMQVLRQEVENTRRELEKGGVLIDQSVLKGHISKCRISLNGDELRPGLVVKADTALEMAANTFTEEIENAYPGPSSRDFFIEGATRIDYKDLYDRVSSEFASSGVVLRQTIFSSGDENEEPVYQQMLKLWTIRRLVRTALKNGLKIESDSDNVSRIRALKSISYINIDKSADNRAQQNEPYLMEFPVRMFISGSMEKFLGFAADLQADGSFLPIKNISIYTLPPDELPPGETRRVSELKIKVVCSSFFALQNKAEARMDRR